MVRNNHEGQIPVNFKAAKEGTYTISVKAQNLDVDYLHLIDNLTGNDVDLLQNPSYTFNGKRSDYASRFRLVFNANEIDSEVEMDSEFAFLSNGNIVIVNQGEATLRIVNMLGRTLSTQTLNGNANVNTMTPGVYVLQLINGNDVKTQKIVIR